VNFCPELSKRHACSEGCQRMIDDVPRGLAFGCPVPLQTSPMPPNACSETQKKRLSCCTCRQLIMAFSVDTISDLEYLFVHLLELRILYCSIWTLPILLCVQSFVISSTFRKSSRASSSCPSFHGHWHSFFLVGIRGGKYGSRGYILHPHALP